MCWFRGPRIASLSHSSPILLKNAIATETGDGLLTDMRLVLLSATVITILGALAVPTVQLWFTAAIADFQHHRSVAKLLWSAMTPKGAKKVVKAGHCQPECI
jgi:hypothetical protein